MLMKIITFFENYLWEKNFLCQENVFVATILVWIEETKTIMIFLYIIKWEVGNLLKISPWKKTFFDENLQRYCINFSELGDYCTFMTHENLFLIFWQCLKMFLFRGPILDWFTSSVHLQLQIFNLLPGQDLLKLQIAQFGKKMSRMEFILIILSNQIWRKIFWKW